MKGSKLSDVMLWVLRNIGQGRVPLRLVATPEPEKRTHAFPRRRTILGNGGIYYGAHAMTGQGKNIKVRINTLGNLSL